MTTGKNITKYRKGDVVLVPFPFTDLSSSTTRPALIVSENKFHRSTGNIVVAMITSQKHTTRYDHKIKKWKEANLLHPSWIRVKLATLDPGIIKYKPGSLDPTDMKKVLDNIANCFGI